MGKVRALICTYGALSGNNVDGSCVCNFLTDVPDGRHVQQVLLSKASSLLPKYSVYLAAGMIVYEV